MAFHCPKICCHSGSSNSFCSWTWRRRFLVLWPADVPRWSCGGGGACVSCVSWHGLIRLCAFCPWLFLRFVPRLPRVFTLIVNLLVFRGYASFLVPYALADGRGYAFVEAVVPSQMQDAKVALDDGKVFPAQYNVWSEASTDRCIIADVVCHKHSSQGTYAAVLDLLCM